jgi:hypothetical protein
MMPAMVFVAMIVGTMMLQSPSDESTPFALVASVATLCIWFADMWRQRAYLHPKFSRH